MEFSSAASYAARKAAGVPLSAANFFFKPENFFLAAGSLLMLGAQTLFDAFLGLVVASLGAYYSLR